MAQELDLIPLRCSPTRSIIRLKKFLDDRLRDVLEFQTECSSLVFVQNLHQLA